MKVKKRWLGAGAAVVIATAAVAFQVQDSGWSETADAAAAPGVAVTSSAALNLKVDLSERRLYVLEGDEVVKSYPVTVGTSKHPTPRGAFSMRRIIWNPRWVPPDAAWAKNKQARGPGDPKNPMGKVKIFFKEPDYYLHGTLSEKELGTAASHGCVRLRNEDIIEVARTLMDHGDAPVEPGFIRRIINSVRSTKEVRLASPVRLRVVQ